jgi:uncharacterized membrane protein
MVRETDRSRREERGWNRLFPTHSPGSQLHEPTSASHEAPEAFDWVLAKEDRRNLSNLGRFALIGVAAFAFSVGFKVSPGADTLWIGLQMAAYSVAIVSLILAFLVRDGWSARIQTSVAIILGCLLVIAVGYEITVLNPTYGTDVIAFAHGGGEILLDGQNPYAASSNEVREIAERFGVQLTRTSDGSVIDWLISYPAAHVLSFATFLAVGISDLRWGILIVELLALAVIWRVLSPKARLFAPFVLLLEPFLSVVFTGGGVTDWLWVLPLAITAVCLNRGLYGYAGLALGIACAVKQHPWFVVPFVLVWVIQTLRSESGNKLSESARASLGAFVIGTASGFLVPNIPFLLWEPAGWLESVLSPALGNMVADGHGLALLVSRELLDLPAGVFAALVVTSVVAGAVVYARFFDRLQNLLWVIPPVVMFLSYRSLHSYFVFWIPIAVLWLDLRTNDGREASPTAS